jgi:hypothetical protein
MTLHEALRAHTLDAAMAITIEDRIGSIQAGKLAEATIINGDLEAIAPERINSLSTQLTVLDGQIAWSQASVDLRVAPA